jgi:hypothetical protein
MCQTFPLSYHRAASDTTTVVYMLLSATLTVHTTALEWKALKILLNYRYLFKKFVANLFIDTLTSFGGDEGLNGLTSILVVLLLGADLTGLSPLNGFSSK